MVNFSRWVVGHVLNLYLIVYVLSHLGESFCCMAPGPRARMFERHRTQYNVLGSGTVQVIDACAMIEEGCSGG